MKQEIKEVRVNQKGEKEIVMKWPVAENPDKGWGARGYERENR